jgi:predicted glutamine amidotransferase
MCRLLGIVADEPTEFHPWLCAAPRSLAFLSNEHRDGWGIAVYGEAVGWTVRKEVLSAYADPRFHDASACSRGDMLLAHVRRRTVGPVSLENTHPFLRGPWVFGHNGTIEDVERLRATASATRLDEIRGSTDSEIFFAYLLTRLDRVGGSGSTDTRRANAAAIDAALVDAVVEAASRPESEAYNFMLADGDTLYAFRRGRTLHLHETAASVQVASEAVTDEPWVSVEDGTLLKVTRRPHPKVTILAAP